MGKKAFLCIYKRLDLCKLSSDLGNPILLFSMYFDASNIILAMLCSKMYFPNDLHTVCALKLLGTSGTFHFLMLISQVATVNSTRHWTILASSRRSIETTATLCWYVVNAVVRRAHSWGTWLLCASDEPERTLEQKLIDISQLDPSTNSPPLTTPTLRSDTSSHFHALLCLLSSFQHTRPFKSPLLMVDFEEPTNRQVNIWCPKSQNLERTAQEHQRKLN